MNLSISEAKTIPVHVLVEDLGGRYSKTDRHGDLWYFSPFRPEEKTASFKINIKTNTWHDFGLSATSVHRNQGSGGDILDLWCDYHFVDRKLGVQQALNAITQKFNDLAIRGEGFQRGERIQQPAIQNKEPRFKLTKVEDTIIYEGLQDELNRRRISLALANLYLKQGAILDTATNKEYTGFLFENDKGGYEVSIPNPSRNTCFKTCIGFKASSRILSNNDKTNGAEIFEGFWDFLSWMEMNAIQYPRKHIYVLNSVSLVNEVCEKIKAFHDTVKDVFLFMDNDEAGYQATDAIIKRLQGNFNIGGMELFYHGVKDLSKFWMMQRGKNNLA